jgi:hypothetical protein
MVAKKSLFELEGSKIAHSTGIWTGYPMVFSELNYFWLFWTYSKKARNSNLDQINPQVQLQSKAEA